MARSTSSGPPVSTTAVSCVITEKCEAASRAAGKPAQGPSAAQATGTAASASIASTFMGGGAVRS